MNDLSDTLTAFATLLQVNAAFLGVAITLIALIPTLVELVRLNYPSFLSGEAARRRLHRGLVTLGSSIWLFGFTTLMSIIGLVWHSIVLLLLVTAVSFVGVAIILKASYDIASIAKSVV